MGEHLSATEQSHKERMRLLTMDQREVGVSYLGQLTLRSAGLVDSVVWWVGCMLSVGARLQGAAVGVRCLCIQEEESGTGGDGGRHTGAAYQVQQVHRRGGALQWGEGCIKGVSDVMCTTSCSNRKDYSPSVTPKNILYEYARLVRRVCACACASESRGHCGVPLSAAAPLHQEDNPSQPKLPNGE